MKKTRPDRVINVPFNNPSLIPIGSYDIDVGEHINFPIPNTGKIGPAKWTIVHKHEINGKEVIYIDLCTLKKVLDKLGKYPKMKKNQVASLTQLSLSDNELWICGDVVKVKKHRK